MWRLMEELANQRERGRTKLPPLSFGKWRHRSARRRDEGHGGRTAALGGF